MRFLNMYKPEKTRCIGNQPQLLCYYTVYIIDRKYIVIDEKKYRNVQKVLPTHSKRKTIQKWAKIVVKNAKRSGTVQKDYH